MESNNWWKSKVVYQIYPKSFKDSNKDGIGDINGIIEELDYLKNLGVEVLWLTPIYVSPQNDNGYDIEDYYNIDKMFGTLEDFKNLLFETHKRGMKLIMDMVINHTSTSHMWFKEAIKGEDNPYHDYYIWRKETNNWKSKFGGSAWEHVESLDKSYLHLFDVTQADLNWENEKLREDIYKVIRYWLDMGVDGFRLDVINLISKDQRFLNDDLASPNRDGRRFYTDGPRVHEYLNLINQNVFSKYENIMTVGEMSSTDIENCVRYTNPKNKELDMVFNFHHLKVDYRGGDKWALKDFDFDELKNLLFNWQEKMQEGGGWNALFFCNHDQPRVVSRFGDDINYRENSATMLATTIHLMRGTPYIYQGEEIGMTNANFKKIEDYRDIESLNAFEILKNKGIKEGEIINILNNRSRDNSRTPMQWNENLNSGFTEGEPWIKVQENFKEINVKADLKKEDSIYSYYKKLISLRKKNKIISLGSFKGIFREHKEILAYIREYEDERLMIISNFYGKKVKINLKEHLEFNKILLRNSKENRLENGEVLLDPYGCIVISL